MQIVQETDDLRFQAIASVFLSFFGLYYPSSGAATFEKAAPYKVNVLETLLLNRISNEVLKQAGGDGHSSESPG